MECPFLIRMTLSIYTDVWEVEIVLWLSTFISFSFFIGQHPVQKTQMGCSCIILPSTWERWHCLILRHPRCCCQISWLVPQSGKNAPGRKGGLGSFWEIYWPYVSLSFFNIYPFGSMDTFPVYPVKRFAHVFPWKPLNRFLSYWLRNLSDYFVIWCLLTWWCTKFDSIPSFLILYTNKHVPNICGLSRHYQ